MKTPVKRESQNFEYSDSSKGAELAKSVRASVNQESDQSREDLFEFGMQLIYGGQPPKKAVRPRH